MLSNPAPLDDMAVLIGQTAARQVRSLEGLQHLHDAEFRVSSQWGEDGIIEWLVHHLGEIPESFIEFGVEDYRESNTRFLLQHRNWRGLVIDGNPDHVENIRSEPISWRHDLTSIASFITRENINSIISGAGFAGELGILSVDIDGMDYWVWQAIDCVRPRIIIVEYNSVFGDLLPLTIPYDPAFVRTRAHHSNLYYGLSIRAAEHLAAAQGYRLIGTNRAGSNAFFVRDDLAGEILGRIGNVEDRPSRFREGRDADGALSFLSPAGRTAIVDHLPVVNVVTNVKEPLRALGQLFSPRWESLLGGQREAP